jgi:hypothetical protein
MSAVNIITLVYPSAFVGLHGAWNISNLTIFVFKFFAEHLAGTAKL